MGCLLTFAPPSTNWKFEELLFQTNLRFRHHLIGLKRQNDRFIVVAFPLIDRKSNTAAARIADLGSLSAQNPLHIRPAGSDTDLVKFVHRHIVRTRFYRRR